MSCYHPKKAFYIKDENNINEKTKNNKNKLYITDYSVNHIYMTKDGEWHKAYDKLHTQSAMLWSDDFIEIPCGHCVGCRLEQSQIWSNRCMLELQEHESSYFVTLTYDDLHLPMTSYVHELTGEYCEVPTLVKRDVQLFIKRLRSKLERDNRPKIRYFLSGEYGTASGRPHYHLIIFGLYLDDLRPYKQSVNGEMMYNSKYLEDIWTDEYNIPKGFVVVGSVTPESCGYTARYCIKKAYSDSSIYTDCNMEPEFTLMSRRPGIGKGYFDKHGLSIFDFDFINISTDTGGIRFKPPRYYRRLAESVDSEIFLKSGIYSECNNIGGDYRDSKLHQTSLDYLHMLQVEEEVKKASIKALQRKL